MGSRKKLISVLLIVLLTAIFIFIPFPAADLHIRILFDEVQGDKCALYYTTDTSEDLSQDKCITSEIDKRKQADFCLDASLAEHITNLRIDWPDKEQLLAIRSVTVSSAGIIQKEFDPCVFFGPSGIASRNGILAENQVLSKKRAYIQTDGNDPYMLLSAELTAQIRRCVSHYRLTRLAVCLFFLGCFLSWKKGLFAEPAQEGL